MTQTSRRKRGSNEAKPGLDRAGRHLYRRTSRRLWFQRIELTCHEPCHGLSADGVTPVDRRDDTLGPVHGEQIVAASEAAAEIVAPQGIITVSIGTAEFSATLADTDTARAFADRLPLTLDMTDVNSNEKAFELAESLPDDAEKPGNSQQR